jgi:TM2 domain-containing membrane protein YozV
MQTVTQPKNPTLAAILSFLINGLGQIYNGEIGKGILILVIQVINLFLTTIFIGFITGPIVFIWSVYDAYKVAERLNQQAMQQNLAGTKPCPQCAERVLRDAKVCRHCGYQFAPLNVP